VPHPQGLITVELHRKRTGGLTGSVALPDNLQGVFLWQGTEITLHPGANSIDMK
jgi:hypothetical protein